ncbi:MAG: glutamate racemase [Chloroflexi bacterium]|nr:glutamate racemase [Chloroflexota bacterium]
MNPQPIGVFDSGVGGLAVVDEIHKLLPAEDILYYADTAHLPYGSKTAKELCNLASQATRFLLDRSSKLVVVACNTASSTALSTLRQTFPIPFVGMVPAVKPASAATQKRVVGVIATEATVQAQVFADLVAQFAEGINVITQPCPGLVEYVEKGEIEGPNVRGLLHHYLDPLVTQGIDILVLGCTHYPFLRPTIEEVLGDGVAIIDTGAAVARQVERVLDAHHLTHNRFTKGEVSCFASGDKSTFLAVATKLCPNLPLKFEL